MYCPYGGCQRHLQRFERLSYGAKVYSPTERILNVMPYFFLYLSFFWFAFLLNLNKFSSNLLSITVS